MDHIVYLDAKSNEFEKLNEGSKSTIIRGATGRKLPYGRVFKGDVLYFANNNGEGQIIAKATVCNVFNSEKMEKETSTKLVEDNMSKLNLSKTQIKKWCGKRYLVLIDIESFQIVDNFAFDKSNYGNMDDWLPVEDINSVRL